MADEPARGLLQLGPFRDMLRGAAVLAVGFLPWAAYSLSIGLGFVKVEVEQYAIGALYTLLYVGIVIATVAVTGMLAAVLVEAVPWPDLAPRLKDLARVRYGTWIATAVILILNVLERFDWFAILPGDSALWSLGALFIAGVVEVGFQAVEEHHLGRFVWRCAYGLWTLMTIPLAFLALLNAQALGLSRSDMIFVLALIAIPTLFCVVRPPFALAPPRTAKRTVSTRRTRSAWEIGAVRQPLQFSQDRLIMPLVMTFLFAGAITGVAVLPHIDSELGGARPRAAYLMLSPADVDNKTRNALFAPNTTEDAAVMETQVVKVLFRNENLFFVRVPPNDTAGHPSYELSASIVRGVRWID